MRIRVLTVKRRAMSKAVPKEKPKPRVLLKEIVIEREGVRTPP